MDCHQNLLYISNWRGGHAGPQVSPVSKGAIMTLSMLWLAEGNFFAEDLLQKMLDALFEKDLITKEWCFDEDPVFG